MENADIDALLARMADATTSWDAIREAEKLDNIELIPILFHRLQKERNKAVRINLFFILGHVGHNTNDTRVAKFLHDQLAIEVDKDALHNLLQALARQPIIPDCSAIIPFSKDSRWLVRLEAISALGSCPSPESEKALLAILASSIDQHDLTLANAALGKVGTQRAIPALTRMIQASKEDVRTSAIAALTKIGDVSILPIFLEALADRNHHIRWYAMSGILKHGDERAITPVIEYVKQVVSRTRKHQTIPSPIIEALEFLLRYASIDERIPDLFGIIRRKKMDKLFPEERSWIQNHQQLSNT